MNSSSFEGRSTSPRAMGRLDRTGRLTLVAAGAATKSTGRKTLKIERKTPSTAAFPVNRSGAVPSIRTSQVLRDILAKNPKVQNFTIRQIVESIGESRVGASLALFSIPGIVPVPGTSNLAGVPTGFIAGQMIAGKKEISLPKFILERSVPRRSLAVAIYAILPVLELAEKAAKPRQLWVSHPASQRVLGLFILILALVIAIPLLGFNAMHATSIFIISLGLVEQDGLAILIGVAVGVASLILLAGTGVSGNVVRSLTGLWMKKSFKNIGIKWATKVGLKWAGRLSKRFGFQWATLLLLERAETVLAWDTEVLSRRRSGNRKRSTARRSQGRSRSSANRSNSRSAERVSVVKRSAISR